MHLRVDLLAGNPHPSTTPDDHEYYPPDDHEYYPPGLTVAEQRRWLGHHGHMFVWVGSK